MAPGGDGLQRPGLSLAAVLAAPRVCSRKSQGILRGAAELESGLSSPTVQLLGVNAGRRRPTTEGLRALEGTALPRAKLIT